MAKHILKHIENVKRTDMFHINPTIIEVVDGWNARTNFDGEEDLMSSIRENGVKVPLRVKKTKDGAIHLIDGERRLRASKRLVLEGLDLKVPVIVSNSRVSEIELFIDSIIANDGKPFTPIEEAEAFKRLTNYGLSMADISKKVGKSYSHVRNRLELSGITPEVKDAVINKDITLAQAQQIAKDSDGSVQKQSEDLTVKKSVSRRRRKKMNLAMVDGNVKQSGVVNNKCQALNILFNNPELIKALEDSGFDPNTLKISIDLKS